MKCPICGSQKLALYDVLWPLSLIFPKKFKCGTCGWEKGKEEVLNAGGLEAFGARRGDAFHKKDNTYDEHEYIPKQNYKRDNPSKNNSFKFLVIVLIVIGVLYFFQTSNSPEEEGPSTPKTTPGINTPSEVTSREILPEIPPSVEIICTVSSDCGEDQFIENKFCNGNNINQKFKSFECLNSDTSESSCTFKVRETTIEECDYGCKEATCLPQFSIKGSKTDVIITNNLNRNISLNVTYNIFSRWFTMNSTQSKIFDVKAKDEESFKVYYNDGCANADCSVSIIDSKEL